MASIVFDAIEPDRNCCCLLSQYKIHAL